MVANTAAEAELVFCEVFASLGFFSHGLGLKQKLLNSRSSVAYNKSPDKKHHFGTDPPPPKSYEKIGSEQDGPRLGPVPGVVGMYRELHFTRTGAAAAGGWCVALTLRAL